ncbi:MAG: hypothetical protein OEZ43_01205 [Gammaproteobacteria bacterium]|nr:hypothetical protein [Gammaproteobacteria bacterium]
MTISNSVAGAARLPVLFTLLSSLMLSACLENPIPFTDRQNTDQSNNDPAHNHNPDEPTTIPETSGADYATGYWNTINTLSTETVAASTSASPGRLKIQLADNGNIYLPWYKTGIVNSSSTEELKVLRGVLANGAYGWTDISDAGIPTGVTNAQFFVSPGASAGEAEGYALWPENNKIIVNEFMVMGSTAHYMNKKDLGAGIPIKLLTSPDGTPHVVAISTMDGGFSIDIYSKNSQGVWPTAPITLHRMNGASVVNSKLRALITGDSSLNVVWIEQTSSSSRIMSAFYNTGGNTWGAAETVLESGNSLNLNPADVLDFYTSIESSGNNLHIAFQYDTPRSIYTVDRISDVWGTPVRRDIPKTNHSISGGLTFAASNSGHALLSWIDIDSTPPASNQTSQKVQGRAGTDVHRVKYLRYIPGTGWGSVGDVQKSKTGVNVLNLVTNINGSGHAAVSWTESETNENRLLIALQKPAGTWGKKEIITTISSLPNIYSTSVAMHSDGTPWVLWLDSSASGDNKVFSLLKSGRKTNIDSVATNDSGTTNNSGQNSNGNTDNTNSNGSSGNNDNTGGNNNNDTTSNDNTNNNSDNTNTGSNNNTATIITDAWSTPSNAINDDISNAPGTAINSSNIQFGASGMVVINWNSTAVNLSLRTDVINGYRSVLSNTATMSWNKMDSSSLLDDGMTVTDNASLVLNPVTNDGYYIWQNVDQIYSTEYMGSMTHVMYAPGNIASGYSPKVLTSASGNSYLLSHATMTGGFGMSVYRRDASSTPAVWNHVASDMLHRMNNATMPADLFDAELNSSGNIVAAWIEENTGSYSVKTATYTTSNLAWGSVSTVASNVTGLDLSKTVSISLNTNASGNAQLVLYQKSGTATAIFTADYNASANPAAWQTFMRRDNQKTISSTPAIVHNNNGAMAIVWIETDNGSGMPMDSIYAVEYMPNMGWHTAEKVATLGHNIAGNDLSASLNAMGYVSALWLESATDGSSNLYASHKLMGQGWSTRERIRSFANNSGTIEGNHRIALSDSHIPVVTGALKMNNTIHHWVSVRGNSIASVQAGSNNGNTGNNDNNNNTGGTTPSTQNWTQPAAVMNVSHAGAMNPLTEMALNIHVDNNHSGVINMWVDNTANGASTPENHVARATTTGWMNALSNTNLFNGLSASATLEFIDIAPATGNLYGLIRDTNNFYLARQLSNSNNWQKDVIPDLPTGISRDDMQMIMSETGMITLTWHQPSTTSYDIVLNARHFMNGAWETIHSLPVVTEKVLTPHYVDLQAKIHAAWLLQSTDTACNGFDIKMSTYTTMSGWSSIFDGPACIGSSNIVVKSVSNGDQKLVVVANEQSYMIDAYIINSDGSWTRHENINAADANTIITAHNTIQVVTGGSGQFMVAWREAMGNQIHYRSVQAHLMTNNNMPMWHWGTPSAISGGNSESESQLSLAVDQTGNAFAVWTSLNTDASKSHVYANRASAGATWNQTPEMLVEYDTASEGHAARTDIAVDANGRAAITWDQQMQMGTMTMHHVWAVESQ